MTSWLMDETGGRVQRIVRFRLFLPALMQCFMVSVEDLRERFRIMHPRMQRGSTDSSGNFIFRLLVSVALRQKESVWNEDNNRT